MKSKNIAIACLAMAICFCQAIAQEVISHFDYPVPDRQFIGNYYGGRSFFYNGDHLGDDIDLDEGVSIRPIAPGRIVIYQPQSNPNEGYGELVCVIEHDLSYLAVVKNAKNNWIETQKFISIYGHIRKNKIRDDGQPLPWAVSNIVDCGDVIGYINDSSYPDQLPIDHNGDGFEHLHQGIRFQSKAEAEAVDPNFWFRGYRNGSNQDQWFTNPTIFLRNLPLAAVFKDTWVNGGGEQVYGLPQSGLYVWQGLERQDFLVGYMTRDPGTGTIVVNIYMPGSHARLVADCWARHDRFSGIGWPIDDGGGIFIHNWLPSSYICQNFRNEKGGESIIMFAPNSSQAYWITDLTWEYYRYGYNGHWGPDIQLPNGKALGCPMSDEENGVQWFGVNGERRGYYSKRLLDFLPAKSAAKTAAKAGMETTEQTYVIAIDLHQADGTLVETYNPDGSLCALTLTAQPMSENHNALAWLGGPVASSYRVLADNLEIKTII